MKSEPYGMLRSRLKLHDHRLLIHKEFNSNRIERVSCALGVKRCPDCLLSERAKKESLE